MNVLWHSYYFSTMVINTKNCCILYLSVSSLYVLAFYHVPNDSIRILFSPSQYREMKGYQYLGHFIESIQNPDEMSLIFKDKPISYMVKRYLDASLYTMFLSWTLNLVCIFLLVSLNSINARWKKIGLCLSVAIIVSQSGIRHILYVFLKLKLESKLEPKRYEWSLLYALFTVKYLSIASLNGLIARAYQILYCKWPQKWRHVPAYIGSKNMVFSTLYGVSSLTSFLAIVFPQLCFLVEASTQINIFAWISTFCQAVYLLYSADYSKKIL